MFLCFSVKWFKGTSEGEKYQGARDIAQLTEFVETNIGGGNAADEVRVFITNFSKQMM